MFFKITHISCRTSVVVAYTTLSAVAFQGQEVDTGVVRNVTGCVLIVEDAKVGGKPVLPISRQRSVPAVVLRFVSIVWSTKELTHSWDLLSAAVVTKVGSCGVTACMDAREGKEESNDSCKASDLHVC